ncbi:Beta-secretase 2 [Blyttiomyces sp. JEL0837]|nr:Beta-secretase 2 [Blyttiomyces sp. JEL0837]
MPTGWQDNAECIVDSCTTELILPTKVFSKLTAAISNSGVFSKVPSNQLKDFLYNAAGVQASYMPDDWSKLPTLAFTLEGFNGEQIKITMSGENYIQGDGTGWYYFPVSTQSNNNVILGAVVYDSFYVSMDRANQRIGFAPGCDCHTSRTGNSSVVVLNKYVPVNTVPTTGAVTTTSTSVPYLSSTSSISKTQTTQSSSYSPSTSKISSTYSSPTYSLVATTNTTTTFSNSSASTVSIAYTTKTYSIVATSSSSLLNSTAVVTSTTIPQSSETLSTQSSSIATTSSAPSSAPSSSTPTTSKSPSTSVPSSNTITSSSTTSISSSSNTDPYSSANSTNIYTTVPVIKPTSLARRNYSVKSTFENTTTNIPFTEQYRAVMNLIAVLAIVAQIWSVQAAVMEISKASANALKPSEEVVSGGPLVTGCYNVDVIVGGVKFNVQLDSGSSDLIIPGVGFNNYKATAPVYPIKGKTVVADNANAGFADGSSWNGKFFQDTVTLGGLSAPAVFAVMLKQTASPPVTDGSSSQGLLGIAFDSISSSPVDPKSVITAMVKAGQMKDLIAIRSCPATSKTRSVIDWGAEDLSLTCLTNESQIAWVPIPDPQFYSINVKGIEIGGNAVTLPKNFQQNGVSFADSCTTLLVLPKTVFDQFTNAVMNSGAFSGVSKTDLQNFLTKFAGISDTGKVNFAKLPTLSFIMAGKGQSLVKIILSGENYVQGDGTGVLLFPVTFDSSDRVILGSIVYDSFYVAMDRGNKRLGFAPGCDCQK